MVAARVAGTPLEHVVGSVVFGGRRIRVAPGVFVPRRRTEFVVECARRFLAPGAVVVDLCCGSGAIGVALAALQPDVAVLAVDIDPAAVACARDNLAACGGTAYCGDLFEALPSQARGRVAVVAANVPYVPTAQIAFMPPEARDHEPAEALDGGADGLDVARRVAATAGRWLAPGGAVVIETSARQASASAGLFRAAGLRPRIRHDAERDATVVIAQTAAGRFQP